MTTVAIIFKAMNNNQAIVRTAAIILRVHSYYMTCQLELSNPQSMHGSYIVDDGNEIVDKDCICMQFLHTSAGGHGRIVGFRFCRTTT